MRIFLGRSVAIANSSLRYPHDNSPNRNSKKEEQIVNYSLDDTYKSQKNRLIPFAWPIFKMK